MSSSERARGRFVTFEGIEGCGKSTQLARLAALLERAGHPAVVTREPGGTELGRRLRSILLDADGPPVAPLAELLLYVTDRAQHLEEVILPALSQGSIVLCDRYLDATLAYQGHARGLGVERILELHRAAPLDLRPDTTVLLDLDPAIAVTRARQRNRALGTETAEGRFERESLDFHHAVRKGYLALARGERGGRIRVIEAGGTIEEVAERVVAALADLLPPLEV